jgi:hypothetical protein
VGRRAALPLALALLACSCATAPPAAPPAGPAPPQEITFHDIIGGRTAIPGRKMAWLESGRVRQDSMERRSGREVHAVIRDLRLGQDDFMVLRIGVPGTEGKGEAVFLYALFASEPGGITLRRVWRDEDGSGSFTPTEPEGDLRALFEVPGWAGR